MNGLGYKLFSLRKDGTLGPLFINKRQRLRVGQWYDAEEHRTKGYAFRPGWHIMDQKSAPHLKQGPDRVWAVVEFQGGVSHQRPEAQGGLWYTADRMRIVGCVR